MAWDLLLSDFWVTHIDLKELERILSVACIQFLFQGVFSSVEKQPVCDAR